MKVLCVCVYDKFECEVCEEYDVNCKLVVGMGDCFECIWIYNYL